METHDTLSAFTFHYNDPTSPPMTPDARSHLRYLPQTSQASPIYKRMSVSTLAQSPPLENTKPIGQEHHFKSTHQQSTAYSSRPSTASSYACMETLEESGENDNSASEEESILEDHAPRRVDRADFVLEELDSDPGYDSDIEVVQPDHCEDAMSENSGARMMQNGFIDKFNELHCQERLSDEERDRIYRRKKERWNAGVFKRSYSQSVEGDSSYSDNDPLDDVDSTARRLRRRVRGPGERMSLSFEDKGVSCAKNIIEVEEPEDKGAILYTNGPPSIPSDDAFTLEELPFWDVVEDVMDVELIRPKG